MEGNSSANVSLKPEDVYPSLDMQGTMQFNHQQDPHPHQSSMIQPRQIPDIFDLGGQNMPQSHQPAASRFDLNKEVEGLKDSAGGDGSENVSEEGFNGQNEGGREENDSPWKRVKWTNEMGKLLITAVSYAAEGSSSDLNGDGRTNFSDLSKRGKWRAISKVMVERGFVVSPQQCEYKFNDLNKKYRRLNDILGRGTCCNVVEHPKHLEKLDLPLRAKEEVLKILSCKQLFYQEMCSYHNGNRLFLPHDWALRRSLQVALKEKYCFSLHEDRFYNRNKSVEVDEDTESNDEFRAKRQKRLQDYEVGSFDDASNMKSGGPRPPNDRASAYASNMKLGDPRPPNDRASANRWILSRMLQLQEQRLDIQVQTLEFEKSKLAWQKRNRKDDMKLDKMRLENERLKLENVRLEAELKRREMGLVSTK